MAIGDPLKFSFRCDSSSHRDIRYMVVGGVLFQTHRHDAISNAIQAIKDLEGITGEIKWSKYRGGQRTRAYKGIIDLFFSLIQQQQIHFHCLIAEFGTFSHKAFPGGTAETSVNRMYWQLMVHRICKSYARHGYICVYPDQGNDSGDLQRFQGSINFEAHKIYGVPHRIACIEQIDSSRCNIIQMVDVVLGGIAFLRNHPSLEGRKDSKVELAAYILEKSGQRSWARNTPLPSKRFTVWNFRHRQLVAGPLAPPGARRYIRHG